jgi:hypothetical protein
MHPYLNEKEMEEDCTKFNSELTKCRKDHGTLRLFGFCNDFERELNKCLSRHVNISL